MTGQVLDHDWYPDPVPAGVVIGERSWLYSSFAFLHCVSTRPHPVRIGSDSGVYYTSFFDLGPEGEVSIGDFCSVVGAIFSTNGRIEVHDYAFLAHDVVLADDAWASPGLRRPATSLGESTDEPSIVVGANAWVGARAVLLAGARVGADAIIGAGAVVREVVPDGAVAVGNPARIIRRPSDQGDRRGTVPITAAGLPPTML